MNTSSLLANVFFLTPLLLFRHIVRSLYELWYQHTPVTGPGQLDFIVIMLNFVLEVVAEIREHQFTLLTQVDVFVSLGISVKSYNTCPR